MWLQPYTFSTHFLLWPSKKSSSKCIFCKNYNFFFQFLTPKMPKIYDFQRIKRPFKFYSGFNNQQNLAWLQHIKIKKSCRGLIYFFPRFCFFLDWKNVQIWKNSIFLGPKFLKWNVKSKFWLLQDFCKICKWAKSCVHWAIFTRKVLKVKNWHIFNCIENPIYLTIGSNFE